MDTVRHGGIDTHDLDERRKQDLECAALHIAQTLIASAIGTGRQGFGESRVCSPATPIRDSRKPHGKALKRQAPQR